MPALRTAEYLVARVRERIMQFGTAPYRSGFSDDPVQEGREVSILASINTILGWVYETGIYQDELLVDAEEGVSVYALPANCLQIQTIRHDGVALEYIRGGERQLEEDYPDYLALDPATATPRLWATRGSSFFVVHPAPDEDSEDGFRVLAAVAGDDLVEREDTPSGLNSIQSEALVPLAAYLLAISDPENEAMVNRANFFRGEAEFASKTLGIEARFKLLHSPRDPMTFPAPGQSMSEAGLSDRI